MLAMKKLILILAVVAFAKTAYEISRSDWSSDVCSSDLLKQYIVDGTKSKGKCPSCGQENMAYQNGCLTCTHIIEWNLFAESGREPSGIELYYEI